MDLSINFLEKTILAEIIKHNKEKYPLLEKHLPFVQVNNREYTGVGMYINFCYKPMSKELIDKNQNLLLSSGKNLEFQGLRYGLTHVLDITDGKMIFLELVTIGDESWDGEYRPFKFTDD